MEPVERECRVSHGVSTLALPGVAALAWCALYRGAGPCNRRYQLPLRRTAGLWTPLRVLQSMVVTWTRSATRLTTQRLLNSSGFTLTCMSVTAGYPCMSTLQRSFHVGWVSTDSLSDSSSQSARVTLTSLAGRCAVAPHAPAPHPLTCRFAHTPWATLPSLLAGAPTPPSSSSL